MFALHALAVPARPRRTEALVGIALVACLSTTLAAGAPGGNDRGQGSAGGGAPAAHANAGGNGNGNGDGNGIGSGEGAPAPTAPSEAAIPAAAAAAPPAHSNAGGNGIGNGNGQAGGASTPPAGSGGSDQGGADDRGRRIRPVVVQVSPGRACDT